MKTRRCILLAAAVLLLWVSLSATDWQNPVVTKRAIELNNPGMAVQTTRPNRITYEISTPPTALVTSYYDYMIGGYGSVPAKMIPASQGGGYFITFHAKRTSNSQRKVFYVHIDANGVIQNNNELTLLQNWEGFPSMDVDPVSGKPIYAWHVDLDPTAADVYDVQLTWDAFFENTSGLIMDPVIVVDNPISLTTNSTTDNEFLWPGVTIGPSPTAGMRRVYVVSSNSVEHTGGKASENPYIRYADFNGDMLENNLPLTWSSTTIPLLDTWNVTADPWRRPYYSFVAGPDGKLYYIGFHIGSVGTESEPLNEPSLDCLINENYGAGEWRMVSDWSWQPTYNPNGYFVDGSNVPYDSLYFDFANSGHFNTVMDNYGKIHFPAIFGLNTTEGTYYPALQSLRHVEFNTNTETFRIADLYPQGATPNEDPCFTPWDLNEDGVADSLSNEGYPLMELVWPFSHWDNTAHDNLMMFHYNLQRMTEPNDQGWMACVWEDSYKARRYNYNQDTDYQDYATAPEIYISLSFDNGNNWMEPVVLSSVETPELADHIPMWVYPADKIQYLGEGHARLLLLFFRDNDWGSAQQSPPLGQNNGGDVKYMTVDFYFVPNEDNVIPTPTCLLEQNYPNPFNPETTIAFTLPQSGQVNLSIYNAKGQLVRTLVNRVLQNGRQSAVWNGLDQNDKPIGSGMYFYQIRFGNHTETRKMLLMK